MKIGVDIDLTLVKSDIPWESFLIRHFPQVKEIPEKDVDYDLGNYFGENPYGLKHMDFWDNNHLYDDMFPVPEAVECLRALKEAGHKLIFISYTKSNHFSSKVRMLKKLDFVDFKNGDAFFATKEKGAMSGAVDVMIEDRNKFLNQFSDEVIKIKMKTRYTQDEPARINYDLETNNWNEIKDFILDMA